MYKILVIGPAWAGDMVMAQSLFKTLKLQRPGCVIDVLAPEWTFSLLARMPEVASAIAMPLGHGQFALRSRLRLGRELRRNHYDQAIVLPNSWKSALIPFFAKIPQRTGFLGELRWGLLNDVRRLEKKRLPMTVQRFVALACTQDQMPPMECPAPELCIAADRQRSVREKFHIDPGGPVLALCPGAEYGPAKRWPARYFAEVARAKIAQGWQVWLFGSHRDKPAAEEIVACTGSKCIDFSGRTTLAEAVDLMSLVDIVISNDSGLMHVAAALQKKLLAIYGSSDPGFTPPLTEKARIISLGLDCSPCFKRECPLQHTHCLTAITPEQVLQELAAL